MNKLIFENNFVISVRFIFVNMFVYLIAKQNAPNKSIAPRFALIHVSSCVCINYNVSPKKKPQRNSLHHHQPYLKLVHPYKIFMLRIFYMHVYLELILWYVYLQLIIWTLSICRSFVTLSVPNSARTAHPKKKLC